MPSLVRDFAHTVTTQMNQPDGGFRTYKLGRYSLIVGPSGSGKTTLRESLRLATTGLALVANTLSTDGRRLLASTPLAAGQRLHAEVVTDRGRKSTADVYVEGAVVKGPLVTPMPAPFTTRFLIEEVEALLSGDVKAIERASLSFTALGAPDILAALPEYLHSTFIEMAGKGWEAEPISAVERVTKEAAAEHRKLGADVKATRGLVESARTAIVAERGMLSGLIATPEALEEAREALAEAEATFEAVIRAEATRGTNLEEARATLDAQQGLEAELRGYLPDMRSWLAAKHQERAALAQTSTNFDRFLLAVETAWGAHIGGEDETGCPVCASEGFDFAAGLKVARARLAEDARVSAHVDKEIAEAEADLRAAEDDLRRVVLQIEELKRTIAKVAPVQDAGDAPEMTRAVAVAARDAAAARFHAIQDRLSARDRLRQLEVSLGTLERDQGALASLKAELAKVTRTLATRVADHVEEKVTSYLPEGWTYTVVHEVFGSAAYVRGLIDPAGCRILNPSGGQRAMMLLAEAAMMAETAGRDDLLIVNLPPSSMDRDMLAETMATVSAAAPDMQVIIESFELPAGVEVRAGQEPAAVLATAFPDWTLVLTSGQTPSAGGTSAGAGGMAAGGTAAGGGRRAELRAQAASLGKRGFKNAYREATGEAAQRAWDIEEVIEAWLKAEAKTVRVEGAAAALANLANIPLRMLREHINQQLLDMERSEAEAIYYYLEPKADRNGARLLMDTIAERIELELTPSGRDLEKARALTEKDDVSAWSSAELRRMVAT